MSFAHDIKKSIKCITCGSKFSTNRNLKRHLASVHEGKKRKLEKTTTLQKNICDVCGRSYVQSGYDQEGAKVKESFGNLMSKQEMK